MNKPGQGRGTGHRRCVVVAAGLLVAVSGCGTASEPAPEPPGTMVVTAPIAESADPAPGPRPYELLWHPRGEVRDRFEDFDFLLGWSVRSDPGLTVDFGRSRERPLWGDYVGRLRFEGEPAESGWILVWPPRPMELPSHFDCVNLWLFGFDPTRRLPPDHGSVPRLYLQLLDAAGTGFELPLGEINWGGWKLVHYRVPPSVLDRIAHPCRFAGFRFDGCESKAPVSFYLDSLSFYLEEFPPVDHPPRPAPQLRRVPGEPAGLHVGPDRLDFPVDGLTVAPQPSVPPETSIAAPAPDEIRLRSRGEDETLEYRIDPTAPGRGVAVLWNGQPVGRFLTGSGLRGLAYADARVEVLRHDVDRVHVAYASGLILEYAIAGASLLMDVRCRGGQATGYDLGGYTGEMRCRPVSMPGLAFADGSGPVVGWLAPPADAGEPTLFFSATFDWTRSHASRWVGGDRDAAASGAGSFGTVAYDPTTDGLRRDVFERIVLTVAPRLESVLPRVPNPPGALREDLSSRVWVDSSGPSSFETEWERTARLAELGVTRVLQCHLAACWQDEWESCTFRTDAAPGRGGNEPLRQFLDRQRGAGWLPGLFANFLNLHPLNRYWKEDDLLRAPSRDWVEGLPLHYLVKPSLAVRAADYFRPLLVDKFGPAALFLQGMTDQPPWAFTDYDSRVPGAGSLIQPFYCIGELLRNQSQPEWGPVVGESGAEAVYAGLFDGYVVRHRQLGWPLLPVFQVAQLNPRAAAYGVGSMPGDDPGAESSSDPASADRTLDRILAAQIAYGVLGRLAPDDAGLARQVRSYYLMQPLQTRYAGQFPNRIAYWNGRYFVNTSEAVTGGALDRSQLYLHYPNQLEVWVNGSSYEPWEVRVGGRMWTLPPNGWVAIAPDFRELSVQVDGRRVDYVELPGFRYFDGRGSESPFEGISSPTPVILRRFGAGSDSKIEIIDVERRGAFRFRALLAEGDRLGRVGYLEAGNAPRGVGTFEETDGLFHPSPGRAALRYVVEVHPGQSPPPGSQPPVDWSQILVPFE